MLKIKDIGANNHYFIRGNTFFLFFFLFDMLSLCNFLRWINRRGACITYNSNLPIIPYHVVL